MLDEPETIRQRKVTPKTVRRKWSCTARHCRATRTPTPAQRSPLQRVATTTSLAKTPDTPEFLRTLQGARHLPVNPKPCKAYKPYEPS